MGCGDETDPVTGTGGAGRAEAGRGRGEAGPGTAADPGRAGWSDRRCSGAGRRPRVRAAAAASASRRSAAASRKVVASSMTDMVPSGRDPVRPARVANAVMISVASPAAMSVPPVEDARASASGADGVVGRGVGVGRAGPDAARRRPSSACSRAISASSRSASISAAVCSVAGCSTAGCSAAGAGVMAPPGVGLAATWRARLVARSRVRLSSFPPSSMTGPIVDTARPPSRAGPGGGARASRHARAAAAAASRSPRSCASSSPAVRAGPSPAWGDVRPKGTPATIAGGTGPGLRLGRVLSPSGKHGRRADGTRQGGRSGVARPPGAAHIGSHVRPPGHARTTSSAGQPGRPGVAMDDTERRRA